MCLLVCLALAVTFASHACAPTETSAKCVGRTTEDVISFQHLMMKVVINSEILKRGLLPQKEAVLKLVEEMFQDAAAAARLMGNSTSAADLTLKKGRVVEVLDRKAPEWKAKIEAILEKFPDDLETRKAKSEEMISCVLSLADKKLLTGIERSAQDCF